MRTFEARTHKRWTISVGSWISTWNPRHRDIDGLVVYSLPGALEKRPGPRPLFLPRHDVKKVHQQCVQRFVVALVLVVSNTLPRLPNTEALGDRRSTRQRYTPRCACLRMFGTNSTLSSTIRGMETSRISSSTLHSDIRPWGMIWSIPTISSTTCGTRNATICSMIRWRLRS